MPGGGVTGLVLLRKDTCDNFYDHTNMPPQLVIRTMRRAPRAVRTTGVISPLPPSVGAGMEEEPVTGLLQGSRSALWLLGKRGGQCLL